jgi:hypothetical protein
VLAKALFLAPDTVAEANRLGLPAAVVDAGGEVRLAGGLA